MQTERHIRKQSLLIDELSHLGIPISKDGIREIALPPSSGLKEQLRAILSLIEVGAIKKHQEIGIHLNMGGFDCFDTNFFALSRLIDSANFFEQKRKPGDQISHTAIKYLWEFDTGDQNVLSLPWVFRGNTTPEGKRIAELRNIPPMKNFSQYAKKLETVVLLAKCIAAKQNPSKDETSETLADIWRRLMIKLSSVYKAYGLTPPDTDYANPKYQLDYEKAYDAQIDKAVRLMNTPVTFTKLGRTSWWSSYLSEFANGKNPTLRNICYELMTTAAKDAKRILIDR